MLQKKSTVLIFDKSLQEFWCISNLGNHFLSDGDNSFFHIKAFKTYMIYLFRALYSNCNFYALVDGRSYTIHDALSQFRMVGKKDQVQLDECYFSSTMSGLR